MGLSGSKLVLVSSVYSRAITHSFIDDASGPLANLAGDLPGVIVIKGRSKNIYIFLYLMFVTAFNTSWFSWTGIYAGGLIKVTLHFISPAVQVLLPGDG